MPRPKEPRWCGRAAQDFRGAVWSERAAGRDHALADAGRLAQPIGARRPGEGGDALDVAGALARYAVTVLRQHERVLAGGWLLATPEHARALSPQLPIVEHLGGHGV